ncbi:MAG: SDR family NAD(P)-dependent oxidoreductase [Bdellovibrionaceae bacterium]|nr:SDR family NAD(P)-dependent oxidoreductase [Pseudobdellovibrionaceae bacterium]NUM57634.1 SDR family NAD(P)-dependent oxidoreductase [Pseudobdellovibrionaceae bacterium]
MKVLITGANGFLGSHLCQKLQANGLEVFALTRKNSDISQLKSIKNLNFCHGDVTEKNTLDEVFRKVQPQVVFHLAGYVGYKKFERQLMEKINVQGTENLLNVMIENKVKKIVHVSSVVAIGASFGPGEILNEESEYKIQHLDLGYFETKRQAELAVKKKTAEGHIESVILNPSTIYGPADAKKGSRKTQLKVAQGKFRFYTHGGVNVVSVEDVIEGIYQGFLKGRNGQRYILSSENLTIKDLLTKIAILAEVKPPDILVPDFILHGVGFIGDLLSGVGFRKVLSRENAWTTTMYHWFSNEKAKNELGLSFKSADYSLKQSVDWMKEQKWI